MNHPSTAAFIAAEFTARVQGIHDALNRATVAQSNGAIEPEDLEIIIESRFLSLYVLYENFNRDVFMTCLEGTSGIPGVETRLESFPGVSRSEALLDGRPFLDWGPQDTMARAARMLRNGFPFSRLELWELHRQTTTQMKVVRDYIAHGSEKSRDAYKKTLWRNEEMRSPAVWLSSARTRGSERTNFDHILGIVRKAATAISQEEVDLHALFGTVRDPEPGSLAPAGNYQCMGCGEELTQEIRGAIQACTAGCQSRWRLTK